mgnify:CR=1 FL=1
MSESTPNDGYALVGFKRCGCAVAVDLDCDPKSAVEYLKRGYEIRTMPIDDAKSMLSASNCFHGIWRAPS